MAVVFSSVKAVESIAWSRGLLDSSFLVLSYSFLLFRLSVSGLRNTVGETWGRWNQRGQRQPNDYADM